MKKNKQIVNLLLEYGIAVVLLLLIIIFATQSSNFLSVNTVMTILKQVSITGIISVGMTFVILTGGIDLSVGFNRRCVQCYGGHLYAEGFSIPLTCILTVLIALIYGILNGLCVTKLNMPPLIATLGTADRVEGSRLYYNRGPAGVWFQRGIRRFCKDLGCTDSPDGHFDGSYFSHWKVRSGSVQFRPVHIWDRRQ